MIRFGRMGAPVLVLALLLHVGAAQAADAVLAEVTAAAWLRAPDAQLARSALARDEVLREAQGWLREAPALEWRSLRAQRGAAQETEASLVLPLRWRSPALTRAGEAGVQESEALQRWARVQVQAEALAAAADVQENAALLRGLQHQQAALATVHADTQALIARGELPAAEALQTAVALAEADNALLQARQAEASAALSWQTLTGLPIETAHTLAMSLQARALPTTYLPPEQHPARVASDAAVTAAQATREAREDARWGSADIGVEMRRETDELGRDQTATGISLRVPFDFGAPRQRELAPLSHAVVAAQAARDRLWRGLQQQASSLALRAQNWSQRFAQANTQKEQAQRWVDLSRRALAVREIDRREHLRALSALQQAERLQLSLQREHLALLSGHALITGVELE